VPPDLRGALFSFKARGKVGGHRRRQQRTLLTVPPPFDHTILDYHIHGNLLEQFYYPRLFYRGNSWTAKHWTVTLAIVNDTETVIIRLHRDTLVVATMICDFGIDYSTGDINLPINDGDQFEFQVLQNGGGGTVAADMLFSLSGVP